jgi:hypothetical protein
MWRFIAAWLGLNPDLPYARDVENPVHGQEAKNARLQKVIYDEKQGGRWVRPANFSDRSPVVITRNDSENG